MADDIQLLQPSSSGVVVEHNLGVLVCVDLNAHSVVPRGALRVHVDDFPIPFVLEKQPLSTVRNHLDITDNHSR